MSKCRGCGITLQNKDKSLLGYTPKLDNAYCERCFKTIHYNEEATIPAMDNTKIINKINKMAYPVLFISDLFSLNSDLMKAFKQIKNDKILVINKCDLIPQNLKLEHLKENIQKVFKIDNEIIFVSVKKKINLNKISDLLIKEPNWILVGETSSGKSSLINELVKSNLTTSKYKNTTLDFIKLKYDESNLYDSPGILISKDKENIEKVKVYSKTLTKEYVLTIDNIKIKGEGNITLYLPNDQKIMSKKEDINLEKEYLVLKNDIELPKGGFIAIKNKAQIFSNEDLKIRDSIISGS